MIKLYWPESSELGFDYVGYNHAVSLLRKSLSDYIVETSKDADYRVYCNLPWHPNPKELKESGLPILMYTMYESTRVPSSWVDFLNKHVDICLVPSYWCETVFINSGVVIPIHVVSLGLDIDKYPNCWKFQRTCDPYRFLWQGVAYDPQGRKGVDIAVKAFLELKTEGKLKENDELILKYRPTKDRPLTMDVKGKNGIHYIQEDLPRAKLIELYKIVDCCINPTHGEGFGLIPLEQMAMGKTVLLTDWSMPYIDPSHCIPLKHKIKKSPVIWNHKHLIVNRKGISFNFGGLQKNISWFPKNLHKKVISKAEIFITPTGLFSKKVSLIEKCKRIIWNLFVDIAKMISGKNKKEHKSIFFYQEHPGFDAHVSIEDLKEKMMWCYYNRDQAEDIAFLAREHVLKNWTLDRIKRDFKLFTERLINERTSFISIK